MGLQDKGAGPDEMSFNLYFPDNGLMKSHSYTSGIISTIKAPRKNSLDAFPGSLVTMLQVPGCSK